MDKNENILKSGDMVEVLSPMEIFATLDSDGTLTRLPFMQEMLEFCGKKFRVVNRINKICIDVGYPTFDREFINNDVVTLENVRCSGRNHGNCQRGCLIFWKESWLKKISNNIDNNKLYDWEIEKSIKNLKIIDNEKKYFCQSTQLVKATEALPRSKQLKKVLNSAFQNKLNFFKVFISIGFSVVGKIKYKLFALFPKGNLAKTPTETLNLQQGEIVEVKPYKEILKTLNRKGKNRGLSFSNNMKNFCGKRFVVKNRLEKKILEKNGMMIELQNTVILEDVNCSVCTIFGSCERKEYHFWREIWLKRI